MVINFNIPADLMGNPRVTASKIDLGAYEYIKLPPTLSNINKSAGPGSDLRFSQGDFSLAFNDINGEALVSVTITALPTHGTLSLGSSPVALNQVITAASLSSLHYVSAKGYTGPDTFGWNAADGTLSAVNPASVIINVAFNHIYLPVIKK